MQLRAALRGRGIAEDIIEESLRRYGPDETGIIVSDLGKRFGPDKQMPDMKDPAGQKLVQSYLRRGFRYGDIREAFQVYSKIT